MAKGSQQKPKKERGEGAPSSKASASKASASKASADGVSPEKPLKKRKGPKAERAERSRASAPPRPGVDPAATDDETLSIARSTGGELALAQSSAATGAEPPGSSPGELDEETGGEAATQLGTERYVLAGFFAAGILGAYIIGQSIEGTWGWLASKDWVFKNLPAVASVAEDTRAAIAMAVGAIVAVVGLVWLRRKPDIRTWADEVASELSKVKWPSKKDVTSSTVVVIAASAVAITYLYLLDNFWGFVTDRIYGQPGS